MGLPKIAKIFQMSNAKEEVIEAKALEEARNKLGVKEVYLSWESLTTVQDRKGVDKRHIRAFTIIGIFVGLLLLIMQEFFIILIIGSLIFFTQAMLKMAPEKVRYEISNHGVLVGETMYYWDQLVRFFFVLRESSQIVAIDTSVGFPGRVFIPFEYGDKEKIKAILEKYIYFLESEPKTFLDNAYDRVVKKFSVESTQENSQVEKPE